jgi:hypothetical protein
MTDERWKALMSFAQFMLGTVVLGVFGTIINHQIQTREVEIKEQELISKNLSTVLSSNTADKLLMAQFYATVTRSEEIRVRWREYHDVLKAEIRDAKQAREKIASEINADMDAKELDQKQARIQQIDAKVTPGLTPQVAQTDLPARVYFHIQNETQRTRVSGIAKSLMAEGSVVVPGIQQRDNTPNECELRYFKLADATEAESLVLSLKQQGMNANAKYVPGFESVQKLRPRHYELWVPATWN